MWCQAVSKLTSRNKWKHLCQRVLPQTSSNPLKKQFGATIWFLLVLQHFGGEHSTTVFKKKQNIFSLYWYLIFRHGPTAIFTAHFCIIHQYLLVYNHKTMTINQFFCLLYKWKTRQVLRAYSLYSQHTSSVVIAFL